MIIRGNTVGTPMPRTNYEQTDPTKADYLKGKEVLDQKIEDAQTAANQHSTNKNNPHGVTAAQVGARPDTWMPTAAQIGALSNKGHLDHATVLEAAMAMPTTGGTFFAVAGGKLLNTTDSAFPGQETVYLMLADETASAARRTVIAIPYGSGKTVKYRTIWSGGWQTDWKDIASPADIGAATAFEWATTIPASGWYSIPGSVYQNDVVVAGLLGTDKVDIDVFMPDSNTAYVDHYLTLEEEFSKIYHIPYADGVMSVRARELPTIDIPIKMKVVR